MQAEGQLARDVGGEKQFSAAAASAPPAERRGRREPAAPSCAARIRRHQGDVGRRPQQIEAERLAVQPERAEQAEIGIDEARNPRAALGEVARDRVGDDRLAPRRRRAPRRALGSRLTGMGASAMAQAVTPSTRTANRG